MYFKIALSDKAYRIDFSRLLLRYIHHRHHVRYFLYVCKISVFSYICICPPRVPLAAGRRAPLSDTRAALYHRIGHARLAPILSLHKWRNRKGWILITIFFYYFLRCLSFKARVVRCNKFHFL